MDPPINLTAILFLLLVLVVVGAIRAAIRHACSDLSPPARVGLDIALLAVWIVIPGLLAKAGALDRYAPLPPPALVVIALVTAFTVGLAVSPIGGRLAAGVPLAALVGFQVFRVPVELLLHRLFAEGVVPIQMTYLGRNLDILSGLTAALVAAWLAGGRRSRGLVLAWNVLGMVRLANIIGIAALSTPTPFRQFLTEPANRLPSMFPYVWLPTCLVQAALLGHLLVFHALGATRDAGRAR
jgi:hypothetical protein